MHSSIRTSRVNRADVGRRGSHLEFHQEFEPESGRGGVPVDGKKARMAEEQKRWGLYVWSSLKKGGGECERSEERCWWRCGVKQKDEGVSMTVKEGKFREREREWSVEREREKEVLLVR